jgi:L-fuconolactonase
VIVDAHVHVFRPAHVLPRVVDELTPAERDAPVEDLLAVMAAAGVERAVLVPLATEDEYVATALRDHPDRFAAVAVVQPGPDPVAELERRRERFPFHAVRTKWLGDPGSPLSESPMLPALRHMADAGLVLWTYLARDQMGLLEQLPGAVPDLRIVLNHLGFFPHGMRVDAHGRPTFDEPFPPGSLEPVLRLAEHPGAYVMFSGQYALSREEPPYRDLDGVVSGLADAFGPQRMLWASDYPWTRDVPGYSTLLGLAERAFPDHVAAVQGGTALELFPHLRGDGQAR